ncbi:type I glyceraldehyde-3-phosphate dehydrogenase [Pseudoalteromonas sp. NZS127_1]|uniref:type I glyceraldehyde-3-phosphate dehydrogenase n=1 Tax=Pseudoalteromonas TaxID=53246 RepID=UPI0013FD7B41|nr:MULTISPECIES: type I glyceraldehyde-3-phosphate dehydrogenase [unclassified Pseudoalteromonas]MBG9993977.1 type I glyceraldehyde-3-phosphate dehydrogenase [Pseudoalteromonas sp. NZS127_1]MBH0010788.1 type I glyceraldehyde-3-phosphate dehydrogenase [Pseudoalteromonas sp. NZS100_1]MBH0037858.1 type I glyceraldehyde-3-phosphate dehydrogenase [Pseudoalteromonas sp. SWN166]MBH0050652.1 type I glyceraldehyde-3-phosphate dehydrogenase [Pseudoalteromonas sp. SWYJZ19]MBH0075485.1 type I glyceraldehy
MINVAINGYGRIGRNVLRALYESAQNSEIKIVAINDLAPANVNAHLTQYDSVHGQFSKKVTLENNTMLIDDDVITLTQERDPANLPWKALNVDIVLECTGFFTKREDAAKHITAGAKKVIVSAPGKDMDATVVHGVNSDVINADSHIISNASCTTNCLAPLAKAINDTVGIEKGSMTTIHSYTNDQNLSDVYHPDLYRARSATQSMIPTKTGAAAAVGLVLPELAGKLDGMSVRVPTINVSLVDFTFITKRDTTAEEINAIMKEASTGSMKDILQYNELPLVSIDFNHNPASSIFDATQTKADGNLVKVMAWYDNEWGFSNRMLDQVKALGAFL